MTDTDEHRGIWICIDCLFCATNDDVEDCETEERAQQVRNAVQAIGQIVPDFDSESCDGVHPESWEGCDCCGERLGGVMHRFEKA